MTTYLGVALEMQNSKIKDKKIIRTCVNSRCLNYNKNMDGKFCPECGAGIKNSEILYEKDFSFGKWLSDNGFEDVLMPLGESNTWVPNIRGKSKISLSIDEETDFINLSDVNIPDALFHFKKKYADIFTLMEKQKIPHTTSYGCQVYHW